MIQSGERAAPGSLRFRSTAWLRYTISLLVAEAMVGSRDLASVGLIALAMALQTIVLFSPGHFRPAGNAFFATLVTLGTLAALIASLAATVRLQRGLGSNTHRALALGGLCALVVLSGVGSWQAVTTIGTLTSGSPYSNDGAVMDYYAAKRVLHGHNPYIKSNIVAALAAINAPSTTVTPLSDGEFRGARTYPSAAAIQEAFSIDLRYRPRTIPPEFESKYNYPAGSFLFILPFVWAGLHDMRFLYLLAIVAMGIYLWTRMPRTLRPLAPFLVLSSVPLVALARGGQPDPLYGLFLLLGFAEWTSPWLSPLSLGVAIGTKQLAWFFLPYYLILVGRQLGAREALRRSALMALMFLVINGPFIVQAPFSYVSSIAGPMSDPMFPLGVGIIALFVANVVPMLPKLVFTLLEVASWGGATIAFARSRSMTTASAMALGALPLFFAWRSLVSYFYLVPILALAVYFAQQRTIEAEVCGT